MRISDRLKTIASMVKPNCRVIDIGCDHGLLDIYLALYNGNICIASDISLNALNNAKENINKYNLEDKIQIILSDGTTNIDMNESNTLIISGMGTTTIMDILKNSNLNNTEEIIIQSNNDLYELRKEIVNMNYKIVDENVVFDKNIFYVIIKFIKGENIYSDKDLTLGPVLIKKNNEITNAYFNYLLDKNNKIISKIEKKEQQTKFIEQNKWIISR